MLGVVSTFTRRGGKRSFVFLRVEKAFKFLPLPQPSQTADSSEQEVMAEKWQWRKKRQSEIVLRILFCILQNVLLFFKK